MISTLYYLLWIILNLSCYDSRKIKYFKSGKSCGRQNKIQHYTQKVSADIPNCSLVTYYDQSEFRTNGVFGSWSPAESWSNCDGNCGFGTRTRARTCTGRGLKPVCPGDPIESQECYTRSCFYDCFLPETDYYLFDLRYTYPSSIEECKKQCQEDNKCVGFTWLPSRSKCHLKSSLLGLRAEKGVISGEKVCKGKCLQLNSNTAGTILMDKHFNTPEDCQEDCHKNRILCSHFVYYTKGHSDQNNHQLCRQFSSVTPGSNFTEEGCIFGPNHC